MDLQAYLNTFQKRTLHKGVNLCGATLNLPEVSRLAEEIYFRTVLPRALLLARLSACSSILPSMHRKHVFMHSTVHITGLFWVHVQFGGKKSITSGSSWNFYTYFTCSYSDPTKAVDLWGLEFNKSGKLIFLGVFFSWFGWLSLQDNANLVKYCLALNEVFCPCGVSFVLFINNSGVARPRLVHISRLKVCLYSLACPF